MAARWWEPAESLAAEGRRSLLSGLGVGLGASLVVVVMGLTASAAAAVNAQFDELRWTTIEVEADDWTLLDEAAAEVVAAIPGVVSAGRVTEPVRVAQLAYGVNSVPDLGVATADAGGLRALRPHLSEGRLFDEGHVDRGDAVCVLGRTAADTLGVPSVALRPSLQLGSGTCLVIGVFDEVVVAPQLLAAVVVPTGLPGAPAPPETPVRLIVETVGGAAAPIGAQLPYRISPATPSSVRALTAPDPKQLSEDVLGDVNWLATSLAAACVLLGAVAIVNTMTVAVLQRRREIGLRRALGARRSDIRRLFVAESGLLGGIAGLVGGTAGLVVVVLFSLVRGWTPVLPALTVPAVALGTAVVGALAGLGPARRAARVDPVEALR